jgi:tetrahydromethanopterin S-methyltransferase subunit A
MIASFIYFSEGLSAGGIAGIVIGILLPLILISVLVLCMRRNRNKFASMS